MTYRRNLTEDGNIEDIHFMNSEGVADCSTFHKYFLFDTDTVMNFGGKSEESINLGEFGQKLNAIYEKLKNPYADTEFAISQEEGQWFGTGLHTYFTALKRQQERYQRDYNDFKSHHSETAIAITPLKENGFLAFSSQPSNSDYCESLPP